MTPTQLPFTPTAGLELAGLHCTVTDEAWALALNALDCLDEADLYWHAELELADVLWRDSAGYTVPSQYVTAASALISLAGRA